MSLDPLNILLFLMIGWVLLYLVSQYLPVEKYNIEVAPLYLTYKTQRLNNFLQNAASKHPQFWSVASNIGVVTAVGEIILAIYILGNNLFNFLFVPQQAQAIFPLLPGITISLRWFPYLLIAIGLAITVHEISHGVVASLEKIAVKSAGIILAPITFGGFVEPDEDVFLKSRLLSKLRLLASGSLANLVFGLIVTLIATSIFIPNSGVLIMNVDERGAAYSAGIRPWEVLLMINNTQINNLTDLTQVMNDVRPSDFLIVDTTAGTRLLTTMPSPTNISRGIMGISNLVDYFALRVGDVSPEFTYHFNLTLYWVSLLMINLAVFNMLPLFPLDGEAYLFSIIKEKTQKYHKPLRYLINGASLSLLASNIALTLVTYGLTPI
jgi:membrane-associated protease RseP (regulator of RpoE activity)